MILPHNVMHNLLLLTEYGQNSNAARLARWTQQWKGVQAAALCGHWSIWRSPGPRAPSNWRNYAGYTLSSVIFNQLKTWRATEGMTLGWGGGGEGKTRVASPWSHPLLWAPCAGLICMLVVWNGPRSSNRHISWVSSLSIHQFRLPSDQLQIRESPLKTPFIWTEGVGRESTEGQHWHRQAPVTCYVGNWRNLHCSGKAELLLPALILLLLASPETHLSPS